MRQTTIIPFLFILMNGTTALADAIPAQINIEFNPKTMCIKDGFAHSLGSRVTINDEVLECVNARPTSYFLDHNYDARWVPEEYAAKQKQGVTAYRH